MGWGTLLGLLTLAVVDLAYGGLARKYDLAELGRMPERSEVLDARGGLLGRLHGENRTVIPLTEVSPHFIKALLAREDSRFYEHGGVDYVGVLRALMRTVKDPKVRQGASTISMQLARNSFDLTREKSFHRKLLEIALTRRIEGQRTKDQILELYVNRIFFGTGIFGVQRAAESYFGKPAKDLTLDEGAMLAAIIRGPNAFSPFRHYDIAMSGRDMVLDRMVATGVLSAEEAERTKQVRTKVKKEPKAALETWALNAVRRELDSLLDAGEVEEGGLKVFTTLEPVLQEAAERSLKKHLDKIEKLPGYGHQTWALYENMVQRGLAVEPEYVQGAVVVLENATGAVRAIVGGRDVQHSSYNRAVLSKRQVGSTFKPFVNAAAVEHAGLLPTQYIADGEIQPGEIVSAEGDFSPKNSDGTFTGLQAAWWGLAKSRNTMAVRVGEMAGLDQVKALADKAGLKYVEGRSPQIYLGNLGSTLESLVSAYSMFGNDGVRCRPFLIDRIENSAGELVYRSGVISYTVISPGTAWLTTRMMQKVMEPGGTASGVGAMGFKGLAAGKTGTTDDYRDAWFVGCTTGLTCGVWVGLDDPERIIHRGYGSRLALPVWAEVLSAAVPVGYVPGKEWNPPGELSKVRVCAASGRLAGPGCGSAASVVEIPGTHVPVEECGLHQGLQAPAPRPSSQPSAIPRRGFFERLGGLFR
ncbi:MAG: Peptidoglycan glycosyltransferase [Verrucomicrobiales bacterium]|nr:Peptidoglycan glycosyltransferase [Verrucomicrobiales bacterium]